MKTFFTILLFLPLSISAQENLSPLEITERFFRLEEFKDKNKYLCCEMKKDMESDSTLGQKLSLENKIFYELLYHDSSYAVTTMNLTNKKNDEVLDIYVYFKKDNNWKIEAVRALSLTGIIKMFLDEAEKIPADSLELKKKKFPDYNFQIENAKLLLKSDKELIKHFEDNKVTFQEIADLYIRKGYDTLKDGQEQAEKDEEISSLLKKVYSLFIGPDERNLVNTCITVGGMLDNTVGYFYQPDKSKVPLISKSHFIVIREIGNGWYLFKTT